MSGVLWIGLLWYLNFVQVPTMPSIPVENRVAITKYIAPNVLFFFRYAALATVVTGLLLAFMQHYLVQALTFQKGFIMIGTGMWMALIMAFNVWFIIWPNQQKILGLGRSDGRAEGRGRQARALCQPLQHHVLDRHAVLHGGAAERADLTGFLSCLPDRERPARS